MQTAEDYRDGLQQIRNILKGNLTPVIQHFKEEMKAAASQLAFERAEIIRKNWTTSNNTRPNPSSPPTGSPM
ncbi:hypothetical protein [Paraflavitalea speifideaquila]|uniref:hypothetical protein n=1 Tax=Paraflavitalea speifideaquila TaxID=3076558 RepID=UPI0028F14BBA|nr:hypothetical protein [Paraflavitalea speifideiaquila]